MGIVIQFWNHPNFAVSTRSSIPRVFRYHPKLWFLTNASCAFQTNLSMPSRSLAGGISGGLDLVYSPRPLGADPGDTSLSYSVSSLPDFWQLPKHFHQPSSKISRESFRSSCQG